METERNNSPDEEERLINEQIAEIDRMIGNVNEIMDAVLNFSDITDIEQRLENILNKGI